MRPEALRAMREAGISPALQYAYRETDFLVMDPKLLSAKEQDEYERAIDEFYTAADSGIPLSELIDPETPEQFMHEQLQRIQVIGGYFIGKHFNRFRSRKTENPNVKVEFNVGFATTSFVRCLRSILIMLDNGVSFDGFNLVRCLYENYLTVRYLYQYPDAVEIFSAQLGIMLGTHRLATAKTGTPRQNKILEIASGREIEIPSRWKMANSLGASEWDLYDILYRTFSSFCDSEVTNFHYL
jgi:hypothetical protein